MTAKGPAPVRPRFVEGQFITAGELSAERRARELATRRHRVSSHTWGVVHGLDLAIGPDGDPVVGAGLAIDGTGRLLTVDQPTPIDRALVAGSSPFVWLIALGSGSDDDISVIRLGANQPPTPSPAGEPLIGPIDGVDDGSGPSWPVMLGRIDASGSSPTTSGEGRVHSGLVGETITAPSGQAEVVIGSTLADDRERFSVATVAAATDDDDESEDAAAGVEAGARAQPVKRIVVDGQGNTSFRTDTHVRGPGPKGRTRAVVCPTTLLNDDDHLGIEFGSVETPTQEQPWTVYRTEVDDSGRPASQLRVELQAPGDDGDPRPSALPSAPVSPPGSAPVSRSPPAAR